MAKFNGSTVKPGQTPTLLETPTEQLGVTAEPLQTNIFDDLAMEVPEEATSKPMGPEGSPLSFAEGEFTDIEAQQDAAAQMDLNRQKYPEQVEQERILPMTERRTAQEPTQWDSKAKPEVSGDGGMGTRIKAVHNTITSPEITSTALGSNVGKLGQRIGAINPNPLGGTDVDPMFSNVLAAVTEKYFADRAAGADPFDQTLEPMKASDVEEEAKPTPETQIKKSDDPTMLGQEIHREYQRIRNAQMGQPTDQYMDLQGEDAAFLGDFAKEVYANTMGDLMPRFKDTQGNVVFGITPEMIHQFDAAKAYRNAIMPKQIVRAMKSPSETGKMVGELQKYTKSESGKLGKGHITSREHEEARRNLASIPNPVDKGRLKILLSTILPALMSDPKAYSVDPLLGMFAEINNFGQSKVDKYKGQEILKKQAGDQEYTWDNELRKLKRVIAQQVFGITQERHGANYLTYGIQAFNGRLSPMQSLFNPTTSKAVRFVTRNAVPSKIVKNGTNYDNAIQAYALVIGQGIDMYVPSQRAAAMEAQAPKLEAWGKRLIQVMDNTMSDAEVEAVAEAISKGMPLTDPNFPPFKPMALDPQADAELIKAIQKKGEDGPAFIDGLMDFAKFQAAMKRGVPHYSYLNPTIDGKTNGIASNGIQMGDMNTAIRTGVIRSEDSTYAVQDNEDIRDQLQTILLDSLQDGLVGHFNEEADALATSALARSAFSTRDLNKKITMTFGYGKEIDSFKSDILETLYENAQTDPEVAGLLQYFENHQSIPMEDVVSTIMSMYLPAIEQVMSESGIESRHVMWGVAFMNAMADTVFEIAGPTGMKLRYGGKQADPELTQSVGTYKLEGQQVRAYKYGNRATAAAAKPRGDGAVEIGGRAWGGAVPGPVQAIDAATVVKTLSGKSWKKLKQVTGGNPYVHQIYDAFKFDIASFGVGAREVNQNWADISFNWSYLAEAEKSMADAASVFKEKVKGLPEGPVDLEAFPFIKYLLNPGGKRGNWPSNLQRKLKSLAPYGDGWTQDARQAWAFEMTEKIMKYVKVQGGQETMTKQQLEAFYKAVMSSTKIQSRLTNLKNKTDKAKVELRKKVMDPKNEIMQYHAH